jgi:hypothetical protein
LEILSVNFVGSEDFDPFDVMFWSHGMRYRSDFDLDLVSVFFDDWDVFFLSFCFGFVRKKFHRLPTAD